MKILIDIAIFSLIFLDARDQTPPLSMWRRYIPQRAVAAAGVHNTSGEQRAHLGHRVAVLVLDRLGDGRAELDNLGLLSARADAGAP